MTAEDAEMIGVLRSYGKMYMAFQSEASKTLEIDLMVLPKHKDNPILRQMHAWIGSPLPEPRLFAYTAPNTSTYMVTWNALIKRTAVNKRWGPIRSSFDDVTYPGLGHITACFAYQSMTIYRLYLSYALCGDR